MRIVGENEDEYRQETEYCHGGTFQKCGNDVSNTISLTIVACRWIRLLNNGILLIVEK